MAKVQKETKKIGPFERRYKLDRKAVNVEARTVELSFSSETPVPQPFLGMLILDHSSSSVRLDRLNNGGAVLRNHDSERHIGVVDRAVIGDDRVGRAVVRFGKGADAEAAFQDVQDGILVHVSVRGPIYRAVFEKQDGDQEIYRALDWEPIEISFVPIPGDPTIGVGRSGAQDEVPTIVERAMPDDPQPQKQEIKMTDPVKKPEEIERERTTALLSLGEQYKKYLKDADVADAIRNGKTLEQFREIVMQRMETAHSDTSALQIGMTGKEVKRYSLARACVAAMTGNWKDAGFELECNRAVAGVLKSQPEGFFVPWDVFARDFNVGTGSEAGNLVATELRTDLFVDVLRNKYVMGMLGVRILAGLSSSVDIPKKTVASAISRVTEIQALTETNPNTGKVSLTPKRFGGYVEYSKQALIQSSIAIEPMLRDDLLSGALLDIQDQWLNGSGSGANMRGIRNTSGIGSVVGGTNGLAPAWSHFVDLESACANANAEPDRFSGYLINSRIRGKTKQTQKASNLPFIWDNGDQPLNGYRALVSNTVPNNLTKGTSTTVCSSAIFGSDWSMSVLGLFGAPDVTVDPLSLATTGQVRITLNQFGDHGVRLAACFSTIDDLLAG